VRRHRLFVSELSRYFATLVWGGGVLRMNPPIPRSFASYIRGAHPECPALPLETFEAAALEWLLLGLVDVPPAGVKSEATMSVA